MAPTSKKLKGGGYWLGPVRGSVCARMSASVMLSIQSRTVRDRILEFNMWNKHAN